MKQALARYAFISNDGLYRYALIRQWAPSKHVIAWLMLNPSVADAIIDDATTRVCIAISKNQGFGGVMSINLYSYRTKDPKRLGAAGDPVGPDNDAFITWVANRVDKIVVAWGNRGHEKPGRVQQVLELLHVHWAEMSMVELTGAGEPVHPLFRKSTAELVPFDVETYLDTLEARHR